MTIFPPALGPITVKITRSKVGMFDVAIGLRTASREKEKGKRWENGPQYDYHLRSRPLRERDHLVYRHDVRGGYGQYDKTRTVNFRRTHGTIAHVCVVERPGGIR